MNIQNAVKQVHILADSNTTVWPVIKNIANNTSQEEAFYICDLSDIIEKLKIWQTLLPRIEPYYAVKCNDNILMLKVLATLGIGFDCASKAEINQVMSIGVTANRIIFANPTKPASHIRYAASVDVSKMTFDNENELYKIHAVYPNSKLVIRIRCDAVALFPLGIKFGCEPVTEAPRLLRVAKLLKLDVIGVSFHVGSGCLEPQAFHRAIAATRDLFDYAKSLNFSFILVDIGGGYPGARGTSIDEIANIVNAALDKFFPDPSIEIISEPGTFFVSSAYTLTCNIHSIRKVIQETEQENKPKIYRMYYIDDGIYGSFAAVHFGTKVTPLPLYEYPESKMYLSSIWGPTCDGFDKVVEEIMPPEMDVGDWVVFEDMGAYTTSLATSFNGFSVPQVYFASTERDWILIKDAFTSSEDIFKLHDERDSATQMDHLHSEKKKSLTFFNISSVSASMH